MTLYRAASEESARASESLHRLIFRQHFARYEILHDAKNVFFHRFPFLGYRFLMGDDIAIYVPLWGNLKTAFLAKSARFRRGSRPGVLPTGSMRYGQVVRPSPGRRLSSKSAAPSFESLLFFSSGARV